MRWPHGLGVLVILSWGMQKSWIALQCLFYRSNRLFLFYKYKTNIGYAFLLKPSHLLICPSLWLRSQVMSIQIQCFCWGCSNICLGINLSPSLLAFTLIPICLMCFKLGICGLCLTPPSPRMSESSQFSFFYRVPMEVCGPHICWL